MRRLVPVLLLIGSPAFADPPAAQPSTGAEPPVVVIKGGPPGTNVGPDKVPFLIAPMNDAAGKLSAYAFVSWRLTANSAASALEIRDKLAFIQDGFLRDVNAQPIAAADDPATVDIQGLETRLLADTRRVIGAAKVKMATVCTVQLAYMHDRRTQALADSANEDALKAIPKSRCEAELKDEAKTKEK
jgi:hypothetical protein